VAVRTLRPGVSADVETVQAIVAAAYAHYVPRIGREPGPMLADYHQAVADGHVWIAHENDRAVGLVVVVPEPDHLLLENIAVAPAAQGRGVGSWLLAWVDDEARRLGLPEVRLYTHEAMVENIALYGRRGYVETHREEQHGFHRVFFRKPLGSGDGRGTDPR
jgi:GNAT superfamily N-acetyltransferase